MITSISSSSDHRNLGLYRYSCRSLVSCSQTATFLFTFGRETSRSLSQIPNQGGVAYADHTWTLKLHFAMLAVNPLPVVLIAMASLYNIAPGDGEVILYNVSANSVCGVLYILCIRCITEACHRNFCPTTKLS